MQQVETVMRMTSQLQSKEQEMLILQGWFQQVAYTGKSFLCVSYHDTTLIWIIYCFHSSIHIINNESSVEYSCGNSKVDSTKGQEKF